MNNKFNKVLFATAMAATFILSQTGTVFAKAYYPPHAKKDLVIVGKYDQPICTDKDECEATGGTWSENLGGCEYPIGPKN